MWTAVIDPSSRKTYYANAATGESRWTPPPLPYSDDKGEMPYERKEHDGNTGSYHPSSEQQWSVGAHAQHPGSYYDDSRPISDVESNSGWESSRQGLVFGGNSSMRADVEPHYDSMPAPQGGDIDYELSQMSAGQIADACFMHQQQGDGNAAAPYVPMQWSDLSAVRPPQEVGRIHTRLHAMYEQLKRI